MNGQGSLRQPVINIDRMKRENRGENPDDTLDIMVGFINTQTRKGFGRQIKAPNGMNNGDVREYLIKLLQGEFPGLEESQVDLKLTMKEAGVSEDILRDSLVEWRESLMGCCFFPEGENWPLLSMTIFYFFHNNGAVATYEDFKRM